MTTSLLLKRVLREPGYGWARDGELYKPTAAEMLREWRSRMNLFKSPKAWLAVAGWGWTLLLLAIWIVALTQYFTWTLVLVSFLHSAIWLGVHGTVYLHRYSTHRAFTFRNRFFRFICRNLSIKIVPEEIYVVSHHVHHALSDLPGDPYNARAGWLYCFFAGELHQQINPNLDEKDYEAVCRLVRHTGMRCNTYQQYQYWGSIAHPARLIAHYLLNWAAWYGALYLLGGHALATAIFGGAFVWAVGIRAHNYGLHAGGKDKRRDGVDFDRTNLAINDFWPGMIAGEWHNNHHLYPTSVRSGFLPWQLDSSYAFIWCYRLIGGITSWRDLRPKFYEKHYRPYLAARAARAAVPAAAAEATSPAPP
jgi:sn-1 stearoyl-lipid 9-desaturase